MVQRNPHLVKLSSGYLFPEIIKRKENFLKEHPNAKLISLGIGDTTEPLIPPIAHSLAQKAMDLASPNGYSGYGPEEGWEDLRTAISQHMYYGQLAPDEIFVSDGTNCDIGRLQVLFGSSVRMAVQDPSYPVYVDTSVILGQTAEFCVNKRQYQGICYLPCSPTNDFFPDLPSDPQFDILYFCSPNNPTGTVATKAQLKKLVDYAKYHKIIIVMDTAYSAYIQDPTIPKSIFEIEGAKEVAIELGSFSKRAGFTGVRLGWSVVPKALCFSGGESVHKDWTRVHSTLFNGASNLSQAGGLAVLSQEGEAALTKQIQFYMENAKILRKTWMEAGHAVYGGLDAPYLWVKFPTQSSWNAFDLLLREAAIVTAPGSGFGPSGEGFIRCTAFGKREAILEAADRILTLKTKGLLA